MNLPKITDVREKLQDLVSTLLKLSTEDKENLIQILSIERRTPCNYQELGVSLDDLIKALPQQYCSIEWDGSVLVGLILVHLFSLDPSELAILVTYNNKQVEDFSELLIQKTNKEGLRNPSGYTLKIIFPAIVKLRLGGI